MGRPDEHIALDGEVLVVRANGQTWTATWHPPGVAPPGTAHGACGWCVTSDNNVVLVSHDEIHWSWPGGRPDSNETWEDTFRREVLEETGCPVFKAALLGFCRSACQSGPEEGLVLVRSIWRGDVELLPWTPKFEVKWRKVVPVVDLLSQIAMEQGLEPVYRRAMLEAGLLTRDGGGVSNDLVNFT
jgi:hypothetical protein